MIWFCVSYKLLLLLVQFCRTAKSLLATPSGYIPAFQSHLWHTWVGRYFECSQIFFFQNCCEGRCAGCSRRRSAVAEATWAVCRVRVEETFLMWFCLLELKDVCLENVGSLAFLVKMPGELLVGNVQSQFDAIWNHFALSCMQFWEAECMLRRCSFSGV